MTQAVEERGRKGVRLILAEKSKTT